jgi:WD40 repeat protein
MKTVSDRHYSAFISYRHMEPDRAWAKWLHTALEHYRVPKRLVIKNNLPSRIRPVFRDEEELKALPDLSEGIKEALAESRFLIVACSPRTPESKWINDEVIEFQRLGREHQILALLIEGEPKESFPRALREVYQPIGEAQADGIPEAKLFEPLAADVRPKPGESLRHRKRMAKLRIIASILGCSFDELRRRDQERRFRRLLVLTSGLVILSFLLAGLANLAWSQRNQALKAQNEVSVMLNQSLSRELAVSALSQLTKDPELSTLLAVEAYKTAPTEESEDALRQAVLVYAVISTEDLLSDSNADSFENRVNNVASTNEGLKVVTSGEKNEALVWETRIPYDQIQNQDHWKPGEGRMVGVLRGHTAPISTVTFSPDQKYILTASQDGTARLWQPTYQMASLRFGDGTVYSWRELFVLSGHEKPVRSAVFSGDGTYIATAGEDGTVRIWETATGNLLKVITPPRPEKYNATIITDAEFSRSGTSLVISLYFVENVKGLNRSVFGAVQIWDTKTWTKENSAGIPGFVYKAAINPTGGIILFVMMNYTPPSVARLWNLGPVFSDLSGHEKSVKTAVFSPDGKYILTASDDGTARLWSKDSKELLILRGQQDRINSAIFSPDGRYIVTASDDGTVTIRSAEPALMFGAGTALVSVAENRVTRALTAQERDRFIHTSR